MKKMDAVAAQLDAAKTMRKKLDALTFAPPVAAVYDPLDYAWKPFERYVARYGATSGRVLFLGMNPGPWGMAQTGVPFGEVAFVRDWMGIEAPVAPPAATHPKYPVEGFATTRSEVSGTRLWGLFRDRYGAAEHFFARHYVVNYCPLLFIASKTLKSGKEGASNLTPDKLPQAERRALYEICDDHLRAVVGALAPKCVVGIGNFAHARASEALGPLGVRVEKILHPSPASPRSNADWAGEATREMERLGLW